VTAYDDLATYQFKSGKAYDKRSVEEFRAAALTALDDALRHNIQIEDQLAGAHPVEFQAALAGAPSHSAEEQELLELFRALIHTSCSREAVEPAGSRASRHQLGRACRLVRRAIVVKDFQLAGLWRFESVRGGRPVIRCLDSAGRLRTATVHSVPPSPCTACPTYGTTAGGAHFANVRT
jgi:hypothetical protein